MQVFSSSLKDTSPGELTFHFIALEFQGFNGEIVSLVDGIADRRAGTAHRFDTCRKPASEINFIALDSIEQPQQLGVAERAPVIAVRAAPSLPPLVRAPPQPLDLTAHESQQRVERRRRLKRAGKIRL